MDFCENFEPCSWLHADCNCALIFIVEELAPPLNLIGLFLLCVWSNIAFDQSEATIYILATQRDLKQDIVHLYADRVNQRIRLSAARAIGELAPPLNLMLICTLCPSQAGLRRQSS